MDSGQKLKEKTREHFAMETANYQLAYLSKCLVHFGTYSWQAH